MSAATLSRQIAIDLHGLRSENSNRLLEPRGTGRGTGWPQRKVGNEGLVLCSSDTMLWGHFTIDRWHSSAWEGWKW
ncbi:hypothetical protein V6N11_030196 [Hibiscus sabdariffa]|uniref:Uncharacterized protein n=1 Tax=Hibiscus sabdariffa TaxID=183260 RepID=A0ABR2PK98_9ROSI